MNSKTKNGLKLGLNYAVSFLLAMAVSVLAVLPASFVKRYFGPFSQSVRSIFVICALVMVGLVLLWIPVDLVLAKRYNSRLKDKKVKDMNTELADKKQAALADLKTQYEEIKRLATGVRVLEVLCGVWLFAVMLLFSFAGNAEYSAFIYCPLFAFYYFISFGFFKNLGYFKDHVKECDYPALYSAIQRAERDSGVTGRVHMALTADFNAGIVRVGRRYSIMLGIGLLDICSEEEVYSILLHEFAHMKAESCPGYREQSLFCRVSGSNSLFSKAVLRLPYLRYMYCYTFYNISSAVATEAAADRALLSCASKETAASALAKTAFAELFFYEIDSHIICGLYDDEEPASEPLGIVSKKLKEVLPERESFWRELRAHEIEARNASHPILSKRLAALGVSDYTVQLPRDDGTDYRRECNKAIEEINKAAFEELKENYENKRKEAYLDKLEIFEKYRSSDYVPPVEEIREAIEACCAVCSTDVQLEFCDRLIAAYKDINEHGIAGVYYTKGHILLHRYDKAGIELIYKAIALNYSFAESGFDEIGQFVLLMGMADELENARERMYSHYQKQIDEDFGITRLDAKDKLCPTDLPAEIICGIHEYIVGVGEGAVLNVYTVKKLLDTGDACYPWIIEFVRSAPVDTIQRVMEKIYEHLDTYPADISFSLFMLSRPVYQALKKIGVGHL